MPPEGERLNGVEVVRLERWVSRGLPWPQTDEATLARNRSLAEDAQIAAVRKQHWAFQPIADPPLRAVRDAAWARTPLDRFVLAELEKRGLSPSPTADRVTLLRRLSFDWIGLPPTPEQIDAFVADTAP